MAKELNQLEQVLVDTIQKASTASGEIYDAAKGATVKTIDFVNAQIPDLIHQLLMWKFAEALVWVVLSLILFGLFIFGWFKIRQMSREENDMFAIAMYTTFGGAVTSLVAGAMFITNLLTCIKIYVAPKIYLIEYVTELLRSVK